MIFTCCAALGCIPSSSALSAMIGDPESRQLLHLLVIIDCCNQPYASDLHQVAHCNGYRRLKHSHRERMLVLMPVLMLIYTAHPTQVRNRGATDTVQRYTLHIAVHRTDLTCRGHQPQPHLSPRPLQNTIIYYIHIVICCLPSYMGTGIVLHLCCSDARP
jgi:hypothetical protein